MKSRSKCFSTGYFLLLVRGFTFCPSRNSPPFTLNWLGALHFKRGLLSKTLKTHGKCCDCSYRKGLWSVERIYNFVSIQFYSTNHCRSLPLLSFWTPRRKYFSSQFEMDAQAFFNGFTLSILDSMSHVVYVLVNSWYVLFRDKPFMFCWCSRKVYSINVSSFQ